MKCIGRGGVATMHDDGEPTTVDESRQGFFRYFAFLEFVKERGEKGKKGPATTSSANIWNSEQYRRKKKERVGLSRRPQYCRCTGGRWIGLLDTTTHTRKKRETATPVFFLSVPLRCKVPKRRRPTVIVMRPFRSRRTLLLYDSDAVIGNKSEVNDLRTRQFRTVSASLVRQHKQPSRSTPICLLPNVFYFCMDLTWPLYVALRSTLSEKCF